MTGELKEAFASLRTASIVLTRHLLRPLSGCDAEERELLILQAGLYNGGLVGVADRTQGRQFVEWWQDRVRDHCRLAVGEGMHFEQRWLDLAPGYFEETHMIRDAGCNVGHWNLSSTPYGSTRGAS